MQPTPPRRGRPRFPRPEVVESHHLASTVGLRIGSMRRARGWSRTGLALAIGANHAAVKAWEGCKRVPSAPVLYRLRAVFGCDWKALLGGES